MPTKRNSAADMSAPSPSCFSMTGFGTASHDMEDGQATIKWELRSVNAKGLDIRLKTPHGFEALEPALKRILQAHFGRGAIQASATLSLNIAQTAAFELNESKLEAYFTTRKRLEAQYGPFGPIHFDILATDNRFAQQRDEPDDIAEKFGPMLLACLSDAAAHLAQARASEGEKMQLVLTDIIAEIRTTASQIETIAATMPQLLKQRFEVQISALLDDQALDPARLAQEVALLASKADIREELDRLNAHCDEATAMLAKGGMMGRRFEFLSQEFNREANTLCAKSANNEITRLGLDLKALIDQFREQIQNIE